MSGKKSKRPPPLYEPSIAAKQDAEYKKGDLLALIKEAVQVACKPAKS